MTSILTITVTRHSKGELTVSQDFTLPLAYRPVPPETERFASSEEAEARVEQLLEENGGPDAVEVIRQDDRGRVY